MLKRALIQPKSFILIFIITAVIAVSSAVVELNNSKKEMLELMEKQGHSILETVLKSSDNALSSYNMIEEEIKQRLLNNASFVKMLYENGSVSNSVLRKIADQNKIFRINIFNKSGEKIFGSHTYVHNNLREKENPVKYIKPLIDGEKDTLIIGVKKARFLDEQRFAVAVAARNRSAIVLNINADDLMHFRKEVGFGVLLKKVTENPQIIYAALLDEKGIIAGSGAISKLKNLENDSFLQKTLKTNSYQWRILKNNDLEVFEVLHSFAHSGKVVGVFRLGLSLDPLKSIEDRLTRRIIIITILLFIFGFVTITLVFLKQNYNILSKRIAAIESYSSRIVDNVSDGIIVLDSFKKVIVLNKAAENIFSLSEQRAQGLELNSLFPANACRELTESKSGEIHEIDCTLDGSNKIFLISTSEFHDENKLVNKVIVIRDLTNLKLLEKQAIRNEKMIAMGKLSSFVAHEIRNPLNSIGTIAQQLSKDFTVSKNQDEFDNLSRIVYKEVKRINETIENFLRFSRPQPIKPETFELTNFFDELKNQFTPRLLTQSIDLKISSEYRGNVFWDRQQIKQVFINLIENSIDAEPAGGTIRINSALENPNSILITISDSGTGISEETINRIFDLYFTTKEKGNGIGLSIVHKIITEHGGRINVSSTKNQGTTFIINLPLHFNLEQA